MTRVLSALVLLPVVVAVIGLLPPIWTLVFAELILIRSLVEYAEIAHRANAPFARVPALAGSVVTCAALSVVPEQFPAVLMACALGIGVVELAYERRSALVSVGTAALTLVYLAIPLGALAALRATEGPEVLLLFLVTVMASDTLQYYGGRAFGRRALAPRLSPKKTVEGALFGFVAGMIVLAVVGQWWLPELNVAARLLLGAALAGLGIAGDLFESSLKRAADLKDASSLIPGHGGVLDRIDGLLFAAPMYYAVLNLTR